MSAASLPLKWIRLPLYMATVGLSAVMIAVGANSVKGIHHLEETLSQLSAQEGVALDFDMTDIESLSILLIVIGILMAFTGLFAALILINDWIRTFRVRPQTKYPFTPRSTRTLLAQTYILAFMSVWAMSVLIPTTVFARTRNAMVHVQGDPNAPVAHTDARYWDYGFLRCLAAAPWFTFIFSVPATIATACAYWLHKSSNHVSGVQEQKADF
ncbi:hypothetical protein BDW22DRAFT_1360427 [Trametopsis cervina]|nr:hypothetical protein BDW22DRAFT_1360427 [Trametopsis cervina]